jgi:hypothetical protein
MAAPTQIGTVTVWGIDGTVAYTGLASTDNILEAANLEDDIDEFERKDAQAEVVGLRLYNPCKKVELTFYPSKPAGSGAIAAAKANVVLPAKGAKVTLAGFAGSVYNDTTWLYIKGGRIEEGNEGEAKIVLPLRRYNTDIAATANT